MKLAERTCGSSGEGKMDDSVLALERAVRNLDEDDDSSGNEDPHDVRPQPSLGSYPRTGACVEQDARHSSFPRGPCTFEKVFEHDGTFVQFRRFCEDHCITRNLNFWLACKNFSEQKVGDASNLAQIAKAIYAKFIKNSAPQHVTVSEKTKKQIKATLELSRSAVTPHLFDVAQAEIWGVMEKNELRQFECSVLASDGPAGAVYTPLPAYGGCGGGSLQHSSSEDSASITSFSTDSDAGPTRSAFGGLLTRPFPSSMRNAISDTEGSKRPHLLMGPHVARDKPISHEGFMALVRERLLAVMKDRDTMKRKAQDQARQQGKSFEDIMAIEWFELPEAAKYIHTDEGGGGVTRLYPDDSPSIAATSSAGHSPTETPGVVCPPEPFSFVNSCAQREVQDALKDLEITKQVSRRHGYRNRSGASSVLSGTAYQTSTDSGVGESWGSIGVGSNRPPLSDSSDWLQAYIKKQSQLSQTMPERDAQAQAAAIALISNSPHPETLNPHVPMAHQPNVERNRGMYRLRAYNSQSTDDSSSCVTMTSMSSQSELFIPRRVSNAYSDQDDQSSLHHSARPHRRQMMPPARRPHPSGSRPSTAQLVEPPTITVHPAGPPPSHHTPQVPPSPHNQPAPSTSVGDGTLVVYHLGDLATPYAKRVSSPQITLGEFKVKIFAKNPGEYRYFFQTYCPDIGNEVLEEYTEDSQLLPRSNGKVMGRVEKIM